MYAQARPPQAEIAPPTSHRRADTVEGSIGCRGLCFLGVLTKGAAHRAGCAG